MRAQKTPVESLAAALDRDLYRRMLLIRLAERRIIGIYPSDKIQSPVHLSIGQEAVAAGVCAALSSGDHIYGTYRGHGLYLALGADIKKMFAELYGKDTGCTRGKGGSMHLAAPEVGLMGCSAIVASMIPVAVGDALAARMGGVDRVVVAFFGDGAMAEGVFFESVNFAVLKSLPIVFVCENNLYAIHSKVSDRHKQIKLCRQAEGLGLSGRRFDGNDVSVVYRSMAKAVESARRGGAPVLLEYMTTRWQAHVGPGTDFQEAYRYPGDRALAAKSDPLKKARARLVKRGASTAMLREIERTLEGEIEGAVAFAESSPFPSPERLYADVYEAGHEAA